MTFKDYIERLPTKVAPEAIEGVDTSFQFDIDGDKGGQYTLTIQNGKVEVKEGIDGEAKCKIKAADDAILNVLKGETNAMMAVLTGKIKISNQGEVLKYAKLLGLM